jgi:hypothetical protein
MTLDLILRRLAVSIHQALEIVPKKRAAFRRIRPLSPVLLFEPERGARSRGVSWLAAILPA